jgi:membrane protein DedA with SNARE-associated domain
MARLTPGMRITTTEVAGLLRVPARTFFTGLVPGAAVYVAVFVAAGWLFGRAATSLLLHSVHRVGLGVTVLTVVLLWAAGIWLAARLLHRAEPESEGVNSA